MLLGNQPTIGAFYTIDDISSGFDGIETSFPTTVGGLTRLLGKPANCIIVVNGVIQAPDTAFTVTSAIINFTTPPAIGDSFWGVILGNVHVFSNIYEKFEIDGAMAGKSDTSHLHDTRYYTETESDVLLAGKSDTSHLHDDRYYTEAESDTLLLGKSDTSHTHDSRYYTEAEIDANTYSRSQADALLDGKSDTSHLHDSRYYTETEIDTNLYTQTEADALLANKVNVVDVEAENLAINGFFDIWQRNTSGSYTTNGAFLADRWYSGSMYDTLAVSRQIFTYAQTEVPDNPVYFNRANVTNPAGGASSSSYILQRIINLRRVSGLRIAVSFWARSPTSLKLGISHYSGDTISGYDASYTGTSVTLTALWNKYTVFLDFPSMLGSTFSGRQWAEVRFWFSGGSDYAALVPGMTDQEGEIDISNVEIYPSSVELPVRRNSYSKEIWDCQEYYQKSYDGDTIPGSTVAVGGRRWRMTDWSNTTTYVTIFDCTLIRPMIVTPNITLYSRNAATPGQVYNEDTGSAILASAVNINTKSFQVYPDRTSTASTLRDLSYHFTAEGEL